MLADVPIVPRLLTETMREKILAHIPRYPSKKAVTLPALHIVHDHFRCVPYGAMAEIAEMLEIEPAEVHDTMSFYGFFPLAPIGETRLWVCRSISCMLNGGEEMLEHTCERLGVRSGQTTPDGKVTVEFAECLGICDFAPAALADDGRIYGPLTPKAVAAMIDDLGRGPVAVAPSLPVAGDEVGRLAEPMPSTPEPGARDFKI